MIVESAGGKKNREASEKIVEMIVDEGKRRRENSSDSKEGYRVTRECGGDGGSCRGGETTAIVVWEEVMVVNTCSVLLLPKILRNGP